VVVTLVTKTGLLKLVVLVVVEVVALTNQLSK
jgi:hypothetical protein